MPPLFTRHVGQKFDEQGKAREFPGVTIICPVPAHSLTMRKLSLLRNTILKEKWHTHYALLPSSSYHMTVFDLVCDQVRIPEYWTNGLNLDAAMPEVDAFIVERWLTLSIPPVIAMRFQALEIGELITLHLEPEDDLVGVQLRNYRNLLSETFDIRLPNHDHYFFHITLAYGITHLSDGEKELAQACCHIWENILHKDLATFDLLPPRLTFFQDMTHFSMRREDAVRNKVI